MTEYQVDHLHIKTPYLKKIEEWRFVDSKVWKLNLGGDTAHPIPLT